MKEPATVRVLYRSGGVPVKPDDPAWNGVPTKTIPLVPQTIIAPNGGGTIREMRVRAVHDGSTIAFLLTWKDDTVDRRVGTSTFRDAVAIGFPLRESETAPSPFMGDPQHPVNIWQWAADFDAASLGRSAFADMYPHTEGVWYFPQDDAVDREVRAWRGAEPVMELSATGFGTLARHATQNVAGSGRNAAGEWQVVLRRDMATGSPEDTLFRPGSGTFLITAVWNGSNREVNGKKSVTLSWTPVTIDPTLVASRRAAMPGDPTARCYGASRAALRPSSVLAASGGGA
jgi:hypothetical protein